MKHFIQNLKDFVSSRPWIPESLWFVLVLLLVHGVWKVGFVAETDLGGRNVVRCFGCSDQACFARLQKYETDILYGWLQHSTTPVLKQDGYHISMPADGVRAEIAWSCTGVKQTVFFLLLLLCFPRGGWLKLPAAVLSIPLLFGLNLLRLWWVLQQLFTGGDFDVWHNSSKYIFYMVLYLLWLCWTWILHRYAPAARHRK